MNALICQEGGAAEEVMEILRYLPAGLCPMYCFHLAIPQLYPLYEKIVSIALS